MEFRFHQIDSLPRLAWCATFHRGEEVVEVVHGPWVETQDNFFCEGAWNGDFTQGSFQNTFMMGSGGRLAQGMVQLVTPSHVLERLHLIRQEDTLWVSNSLVFVLSQAGEELDPSNRHYSRQFGSIQGGLNQYIREISTRSGNQVHLRYYCNLWIDSDTQITERPKNRVRTFRDFADYRSFVQQGVWDIWANLNHPGRKVHYTPISTLSAGYDSPTSTVFAKSVGCEEVLILKRQTRSHAPMDYGGPIAEQLGMRKVEHDRWQYLELSDCPEAEFLSYCPSGMESNWAPFEPDVEQRVVFTGYGGTIWDWTVDYGADFGRSDISGVSLGEFRIRTGFVHLPVAFIGYTSRTSIRRISTSAEMAPWSIGEDYDRPIARRIIEEAGVDRHLFGQQKHGSVVKLSVPGVATGDELVAPQRIGGMYGPLTEQTRQEFTRYFIDCMEEGGITETSQSRQRGLLMCWGIDKIRHRYKAAREVPNTAAADAPVPALR